MGVLLIAGGCVPRPRLPNHIHGPDFSEPKKKKKGKLQTAETRSEVKRKEAVGTLCHPTAWAAFHSFLRAAKKKNSN